MTYKNLPALIEQRRHNRGWTQAELARRAGVSPSAISVIEQGHANVSVDTLDKIARALKTTAPKMLVDSTKIRDA